LIYAAKPQRGGRSIQANTNNPPQDPPPSKDIPPIIIPKEDTPKVKKPKVTKAKSIKTMKKPIEVKVSKVPWLKRLLNKLLFWRKNNG
jgi:hypothetical protein